MDANEIVAHARIVGKSTLVKRLLKFWPSVIDSRHPDQLVYCYRARDPDFEREITHWLPATSTVEFYEGLPIDVLTDAQKFNKSLVSAVVLDDLASTVAQSDTARQLFQVFSHHRRITVILLLQVLCVR